MRPTRLISALLLAGGLFASPATLQAAEHGTAAEAALLLDRAIAEVKADASAAIAKFNDAAGAFRDRDLYVFCASETTGKLVAHPALVGTDLRGLKDKNGKAFGAEIFEAKDGAISEVAYVWPRPSGGDPVAKISRVTKIGDLVCGVGYYAD